jgi:septal ring factor EnvC (AmiA/AmiB activator)
MFAAEIFSPVEFIKYGAVGFGGLALVLLFWLLKNPPPPQPEQPWWRRFIAAGSFMAFALVLAFLYVWNEGHSTDLNTKLTLVKRDLDSTTKRLEKARTRAEAHKNEVNKARKEVEELTKAAASAENANGLAQVEIKYLSKELDECSGRLAKTYKAPADKKPPLLADGKDKSPRKDTARILTELQKSSEGLREATKRVDRSFLNLKKSLEDKEPPSR